VPRSALGQSKPQDERIPPKAAACASRSGHFRRTSHIRGSAAQLSTSWDSRLDPLIRDIARTIRGRLAQPRRSFVRAPNTRIRLNPFGRSCRRLTDNTRSLRPAVASAGWAQPLRDPADRPCPSASCCGRRRSLV
jgi:hypothetical protein